MFRLLHRLIKDNAFRLLFLFAGTAVVTSICLLCFADLENAVGNNYQLLNLVPSDSLLVLFEGGTFSEDTARRISEQTSAISNLEEVKEIIPFGSEEIYFYDEATDLVFWGQMYNQPVTDNFVFELDRGRTPVNGANEVLITADITNRYDIGDTIHVRVIDWVIDESSEQVSKYYQTVDLTVVGIISDNSPLLLPSYYGGLEENVLEGFSSVSEQTGQTDLPLIISYDLYDIDGLPLQHSYEHSFACEYIVICNDNDSTSNIENEINSIVRGYGQAKTAEEYINEAIELKWNAYRPVIGITLTGVFMMAITITSIYLFQIKKGMKALISYYICGASWNRILLSLCLINLPIALLGYLAGLYYFEVSTSNWEYMRLSPASLLFTLMLIIVIQIIISLVFFLSMHRISPASIRRLEDE